MKNKAKRIIAAVIALAFCTMSSYADWFGIMSITDDDDLPDVYRFHDYTGVGIMPNMNNDEYEQPNIQPDMDDKKYEYSDVMPDMDTDSYEYPNVMPNIVHDKMKGSDFILPDTDTDSYEYPNVMPDIKRDKMQQSDNIQPDARGRYLDRREGMSPDTSEPHLRRRGSILPDTSGQSLNKGATIKPDMDNDSYEYPDVKPDMSGKLLERGSDIRPDTSEPYLRRRGSILPSTKGKSLNKGKYIRPDTSGQSLNRGSTIKPDMSANSMKMKDYMAPGYAKGIEKATVNTEKVLPQGKGKSTIKGLSGLLNAGVSNILRHNKMENQDYKMLEIPLATGINVFGNVLYNFRNTVLGLCYLFAILNILLQVFKLWFGTQELKKFYVDIIWKSVCCILLLYIYPATVDGIISLASGFGVHVGSGYDDLNMTYGRAIATLYSQTNLGISEVKKVLKNATFEREGTTYIPASVYKQVAGYLTEDYVKEYLQSGNITIVNADVARNGKGKFMFTYITPDGKTKTDIREDYDSFSSIFTHNYTSFHSQIDAVAKAADVSKLSDIDPKLLKKQTAKLYALSEIVETVPISIDDYIKSDNSTTRQQALNTEMERRIKKGEILFKDSEGKWTKPILQPFLKDKDSKFTTIISPSAMIQMCVTLVDAAAYAMNYDSEKVANKGTKDEDPEGMESTFNPKGHWQWPGVRKLLFTLLMEFGMLFCVLIVMADYTIAILEYYIVTSLGAILIPFMFLDATKEYTKNLLKLFLQFFFKVTVQVLAVFTTMGLYLSIANLAFVSLNFDFIKDLATFLGTLAIGLLLCGSAGKIAGTLLSGQPSLSAGDIAHQAHHAMAAGRMAGGAVKGAAGLVTGHRGADGKMHGGLIPGAQGVARMASHHNQNTAAKKAGGAKAKESAMGQFGTAGGEKGGYQSSKGGVGGGQFFSNADLKKMEKGEASSKFGSAEEQKAKYDALKNEAGDRAAKGFEHQASKQWWANARYKAMTGGEEKIMGDQNQRFTGVGSRSMDARGNEVTGNLKNQSENMTAAGEQYGKNALSFFQPPKDAQPGTGSNSNNSGTAGNKGVSPENKIV